MNKSISEQGWYVRTYDRDIFITESQKQALYAAMDRELKYFDLEGNRIMMHQVKEVIKAAEYIKSPQGGYHCPKHPKNFVPKGKTCGYCG